MNVFKYACNYSEKVNSAIINPKEKRFRTKSHGIRAIGFRSRKKLINL